MYSLVSEFRNSSQSDCRPGIETLRKTGGLHKFMGWDRALLTDSGGFQMVSLLDLAEITEDGVKFRSPYDDSECMLTPERSIEIQGGQLNEMFGWFIRFWTYFLVIVTLFGNAKSDLCHDFTVAQAIFELINV